MFIEIDIRDVKKNMVKAISDEWMLISAGDENKSNMMTASWGLTGELWFRDVAVCFIRPQRYTLEFVEQNDTFALCFFGTAEKQALSFCGSKSGRDYDKIKETGLTPVYSDGTVYYEQANLVLICKKIAVGNVTPEQILDKTVITRCYPEKDFHKIFVGEIVKVLENK
ncbi:MAG: flavin reductase family protein [Clostridia bacterium]|nr:flavin reductase family protein [Clostridia bacterium]